MKKKKIVVSVLVVCLLCVHVLSTAVRAEETEHKQYYASNGTEFKSVLHQAGDGDTIIITDAINLNDNVQIGSDTKHLTIERTAAYSRIVMAYGCTINVMNVTFDGKGVNSVHSLIQTSANVTFDNCNFINCGNRENFSSSGSDGGAVNIQACSGVFNACLFEENFALLGGSIAVTGDSKVEMNNCTLKDSGAVSSGGAVFVSENAMCNISDCTIMSNKALDFGGGVSNAGNTTITGTKVYANSAVNGGADIATKVSGVTTLTDTVEQLNELFSTDNFEVTGWVCDYDFDENIYIPDVDPTKENALLKLQYSEKQPETPEPTEPTDPVDPSEPSEPSTPTDTEKPDETEPGTEPSETPEPTQPGKEEPDGKTDQSKSDDATNTENSGNTTTDTTNTNTSTVSSGDTVNSTTTNTTTDNSRSRVDNSKVNSTGDTSTTTTNNYYQVATGDTSQPVIQDSTPQHENNTYIVYPNSNEVAASSAGMDETVKTSDPVQNLNIDAKGVDCKIEVVDGKYNISINADQQQTAVDDSVKDNGMDWLQIIQVVLLVAILICLVRKPKER